MRLAAMAYRPRSAKTAYGSGIRNIRLPYIYDIPNAHQPAPHVAGGRHGSNHPHLIVHSQFLHQLGLHLLENTEPLDLGEQISRVLGARYLLKLHQ